MVNVGSRVSAHEMPAGNVLRGGRVPFIMRAAMKSPARWIAVALALAAAISLGFSIEGNRWWSFGDVTVGPFGTVQCFGGHCRQTGFSWLQASETWLRTATGTGAAGTFAAFALILLAGATAAGRVARLLAQMALVALGTALAAAIAFVVLFPRLGAASLDIGLVLFGVGIVLGAVSPILVLRTPRP